jgi:NAD(P)-dependent dehydrogenase (short-subunit alcohol dehydrogenase family)
MNKTILITGSSSGIGKATAKMFQQKGWNVIATMRNPEAEKELADLDNLLVCRLDVLDMDSILESVKKGIERFGKIDVLVNNAGYGAYGPLESFSRESILRQFNTNVIGLIDVTRAIMPHFRSHKSGLIINISSMGGRFTFPLGSLYHGTKFAVEGISESLSFEVEPFGGYVKIIEPGAIATDFAGRSFEFSNDASMVEYQTLVQSFMAAIPHMVATASHADMVAGTIFEAVTDGKRQLRYIVGEDAKAILKNRKELDEELFVNGMKSQFGL